MVRLLDMATTKKDILPEELETVEPTIYEVSYLLDTSLSEDDARSKHSEFKAFLTDRSGEVIAEGEPESRKLAYLMTVRRDSKRKDHTRGYFGWIKFALTPEGVQEVESMLKADSSVIRSLVIKTIRETLSRERIEGIDDEENVEIEEDFDTIDEADNTKEEESNQESDEV